METDKYQKPTKRVSNQGDTMLTAKDIELQSDMSTDFAHRMAQEINQIFEATRKDALGSIEKTKMEALTYIENARRKALQCIYKGQFAGMPKEENKENIESFDLQKAGVSISYSPVAGKVTHQPHFVNAGEDEDDNRQNSDDHMVDDVETVIRENLDRYNGYISEAVKATDLIAFYDLFTTSQTKELRSIYRSSPHEATERAFEKIRTMKHQPYKYRRLLVALKDTGYPKIVQILEGKLIPTGSCHRDMIRTCAKHIFQQLNTTEVLPHLYSKGVISGDDRQQIQRTEMTESTGLAALELLDLLRNRSEQWFRHL